MTHKAINDLQDFIRKNKGKVKDFDSDRPMTFHGLRHLCASEWYLELRGTGYGKKAAMKLVSQRLGHERMDVTRIYLAPLTKIQSQDYIQKTDF
jgi:integrase